MRRTSVLIPMVLLLAAACASDVPTDPVERPTSPTAPATPGTPSTPTSPPSTPPSPPVPRGPARIFLANSDGSSITGLVNGENPAWSPDGNRIAFDRAGTVYLINADGTNEVALVYGGRASWSPDGARIAYVDGAGIRVVNAGGGAAVTLIGHQFRTDTYRLWDMGVSKPAWSPDGKQIAFEHQGDGDMTPATTFIMNADGSNPRMVTAGLNGRRYAESDPAWSPDGSRIVYWSYGFGIATVDLRSGVPNALYIGFPAVAYGAKPAWSPDGTRVVFNTYPGTTGSSTLLVVGSNGGAATPFITDGYSAAWSPKGDRLAFVSTRIESTTP